MTNHLSRPIVFLLSVVVALGLTSFGGNARADQAPGEWSVDLVAESSGESGVTDGMADEATDDVALAAVGCPSGVTKKMCRLYKSMYDSAKKGKYLWDKRGRCKGPDRLPYHPEGRACDLVYGKIGKPAGGDALKRGNRLKDWLVANHRRFQLHHVIWNGKIYSSRTNWRASGRPYSCSGTTDCHRDHIHVAVNR
ncbi:hypothetical protein GCM10022243_31350 [Saccharothrix violaceirubra]|uniref:ARB-07466-like C-terminal domain-containing protein n=1 Tax=Saccharothrix violaceirubra TaxID=413306 RepID=A0A7W7T544_9PSEU|nr:hypothetical protein [Saccharothrix violaceirubra]MBB4966759.1 hypothetical protein [Saccharothrix violaceirubra]